MFDVVGIIGGQQQRN